jgi:hypothetical protein
VSSYLCISIRISNVCVITCIFHCVSVTGEHSEVHYETGRSMQGCQKRSQGHGKSFAVQVRTCTLLSFSFCSLLFTSFSTLPFFFSFLIHLTPIDFSLLFSLLIFPPLFFSSYSLLFYSPLTSVLLLLPLISVFSVFSVIFIFKSYSFILLQ